METQEEQRDRWFRRIIRAYHVEKSRGEKPLYSPIVIAEELCGYKEADRQNWRMISAAEYNRVHFPSTRTRRVRNEQGKLVLAA